MLKRFFGYYKNYKPMFFADLGAAVLLAACDLFYPSFTRYMLNTVIPNGWVGTLLILAGVLLGLYLLKMLLTYFTNYIGHMVSVYMQADMRRDLFDHYEALPCTFFDNHKTGALMSRLTNDLFDVSELAHHGPEDLLTSFTLLIGAFVLMARIDLPLTLITFTLIPLIVWFSVVVRRKMKVAFRRSREEIAEVNANLENSISGIRVSKAYDSEAVEHRRFEESNRRFVAARRASYRAMGEFAAGNTFMTEVLNLVMLLAGGLFVLYGRIDYADLIAFMLYVNVFLQPIRKLMNFVEQYQEGMSGFTRFCEIMDTPVEADAPDAVSPDAPARGEIVFDHVGFSYPDEQGNPGAPVLRDLCFSLPAGKTLALVGASGEGKSTVCHLIPRFYEISEGSIRLDGTDIRSLRRSWLRRQIGIVAQDVFLFNDTIYNNILYGRPDATEEEVYEAARLANIDDYVRSMPEGYRTVVGERGVKLSGGQKQRVSIARAFLKNPPVLILDEATSALDTVTERQIQHSLSLLSRGRTTIVVAHRLSTVQAADEILLIDDGRVAERGDHASLLQAGGAYAQLVQATMTEE